MRVETQSVREPRQPESDYFQMNYENPEKRERERERTERFSVPPGSLRLGWELFVSGIGQVKSSAWGELGEKYQHKQVEI